MVVIYFIAAFALLDGLWWVFADRLARRTTRPVLWRGVAAITAGLGLLGLVLLLLARLIGMTTMVMPELAVMAVYLWHFIVLPAAILPTALAVLLGGRRRASPAAASELAVADVVTHTPPAVSRRDFLTRGLIVLPPLATVAMAGRSKWTEDDLRLRTINLAIKGLPRALDGLTIAHVTDPHLGSFISDAKVKKIIEMTNQLDADLVLQTGDLINSSLSDLPDGIHLLRQLRGRYGVWSCQGNHDCIADRNVFNADVKRAGLNLMVHESDVVQIRNTPVRLLGLRWWGYADDLIAWTVGELARQATPDAFNILLAHHPHAFDAAAAAGIPLTLSGHTHGGQIALNARLGVGPIMYRYWSGAYQKLDSTLVVSNGTGNWFPLRINVPCEILKVTLHGA